MTWFPYEEVKAPPSYADRTTSVWRPKLPISLRGLDGRYETRALVDTGAVETIFPMHLWDVVGPAHRPGEVGMLEGADGSAFEVRYGTIDLGIKLGSRRHWWSAVVGFTGSRNEAVLGDAAFLRFFSVNFDRRHKSFLVRLSGPLPLHLMLWH